MQILFLYPHRPEIRKIYYCVSTFPAREARDDGGNFTVLLFVSICIFIPTTASGPPPLKSFKGRLNGDVNFIFIF